MTDDDGALTLQLFDFGIGKEAEAEKAGTFVGTKGYMSPEVYRPNRKNRDSYSGILADIWSSGVVFVKLSLSLEAYEEIDDTWRRDSGFNNALISQKLKEAGCSNDFTNLLTSMLAFDPEKRPSPLQAYEHCAFNGMPSLFDLGLRDWKWIQSVLRNRVIKKQQTAEIAELIERLAAAEASQAADEAANNVDSAPNNAGEAGGGQVEEANDNGGPPAAGAAPEAEEANDDANSNENEVSICHLHCDRYNIACPPSI